MARTTAPNRTNAGRSFEQQPIDGCARQGVGRNARRWASLVGGGTLALYGLSRGSVGGLGLALLGGGLAYRAATGRPGPLLSALGAKQSGVRVVHAVTVLRPRDELYRFWRDFENLPQFMRYLRSVRTLEGGRTRWVASGPVNVPVEWEAEVTAESPGEYVSWRSLPGSVLETEGTVRFADAPADRGTVVRVDLRYDPPAGRAGAALAWLFGRSGEQTIREDLRRFKRLLETGEIPSTRGQPSGRGRDLWEQTGSMIVDDRIAAGLGWFSIALGLSQMLAPGAVARACGVRDHRMLMRGLGAREFTTGVGILTRRPHPTGWLWGRVAGDAMDLTLLGKALASPRSRKLPAILSTAAVVGVTAADVFAALQHASSPGTTGSAGPHIGRTDADGRGEAETSATRRESALSHA